MEIAPFLKLEYVNSFLLNQKYSVTYGFSCVRSQPLTLAELCRIRVRRRLGERIQYCLEASSLPARVVRFLLLEDVAEVDL